MNLVSNKDVNVSNYVVLNSGPSAHPARFRAEYDRSRPTSVQLSWEAVPEEQRNGVITGYVLVVTAVTGNDIISNTTALRPSLFLYQVTGLMIDTVYTTYHWQLVLQSAWGPQLTFWCQQ